MPVKDGGPRGHVRDEFQWDKLKLLDVQTSKLLTLTVLKKLENGQLKTFKKDSTNKIFSKSQRRKIKNNISEEAKKNEKKRLDRKNRKIRQYN